MRIVTWNMDHWRRPAAQRLEAWEFLRTRIQPDIALVQEAVPPSDMPNVIFRQGGLHDERKSPPKDLGWGSAVVSFERQLQPIYEASSPFHDKPIPLLRTFPGSVAIAEIADSGLAVVSAYGVIDRGYADSTVHRILSDLTPLLDQRRARGIVFAGDLNITTQWSAKHKGFLRGRQDECLKRDANLFERFDALGLHNVAVGDAPLENCLCTLGAACRHVQTQRHERSEFPWQNDYIFVTADLLERKPRVEVLDDEAAWRLSGHCPLVVDIGGAKPPGATA